MKKTILIAERLCLVELNLKMANAIHLNSLDEATRSFIPDEVFETKAIAAEAIEHLTQFYTEKNGPLVYAICLIDETVIGYVQIVPFQEGWELGYQIAKSYRGHGYAREAIQVFIPWVMDTLKIDRMHGVCLVDNIASIQVLKNSGFEHLGCFNEIYQGRWTDVEKFIFYHTLPR